MTQGDPAPESKARVHGLLADVAQQVDDVLEAAERSAAEIRAHAQSEASELLDRARADAQRDSAARKAAAADALARTRAAVGDIGGAISGLREQLRNIDRELERAGEALGGTLGQLDAAASQPSLAEGPIARGRTRVSSEGAAQAGGLARSARVRAAQMAMAGQSREEIETVLRNELGVADPTAILDEALGRDNPDQTQDPDRARFQP